MLGLIRKSQGIFSGLILKKNTADILAMATSEYYNLFDFTFSSIKIIRRTVIKCCLTLNDAGVAQKKPRNL